jgi:hypothetical protein
LAAANFLKGMVTIGAITAVPVLDPFEELFNAPWPVVSIVKLRMIM